MWGGEPERAPVEGVPVVVLPPDLAPVLSETELVADIWSADVQAAREHAHLTVAVARLARRRRRTELADRGARGGPGPDARRLASPVLADVSEDFVTELALIRCCSEYEAQRLAAESILLTGTLTATWAELYAGRITVRKASAVVDLLADVRPTVAREVERRVLPNAGDRPVGWLRDAIRRQLARLDAEALDRRRRAAAARRDVWRQPTADGLSQLIIENTTGKTAAAWQAIDAHAQAWRADGDDRPIGVLRTEVAFDLITRPWATRPPVTAILTIHAPLDALRPPADGRPQPAADVDGAVVTAAECRALLTELDILGVQQAPPGGCVRVAVGDPVTGRLIAVATRRELASAAGTRRRRRARRTAAGAAAPPAGPQDGPGLRPPPGTHRYRPTAAQQRHLHTRDRHCRMPGCRRRPGRCDLDHVTAHTDGGPTTCWNLCCLCRHHHRIKTFARGWHFELLPDGQLLVRTPAGVTRTTAPPGYTTDPEPDPPWLDDEAPPDLAVP